MLIPQDIALFSTTLVSGISTTDTTMTLASASYNNGLSTLASSTYMFTIGGTEIVTADCTGTVCTNMTRGIDQITGTSSVSGLKEVHRRGDSVKISTASQVLYSNIFLGKQTIANALRYASALTFTYGQNQLVTYDKAKDYTDGVAVAGAPNADGTTKGIVQVATAAQASSTTALAGGSTGASLAIMTNLVGATPFASGIVMAQSTGKILQGWLDLAASWVFTGGLSSTGTTTVSASHVSTNPFVLNGLAYKWPSVRGASSTSLREDGVGNLQYYQPDRLLYLDPAPTGINNSTASSTVFKFDVPANVLGTSNVIMATIPFNTLQLSGAQQQWFDVGYGGSSTTPNAITGIAAQTLVTRGEVHIYLIGNGATNSQKLIMNVVSAGAPAAAAGFAQVAGLSVSNTISIDSTVSKQLVFIVRQTAGLDANDFTPTIATVELKAK